MSSSNDSLPQIDVAYLDINGFDSLKELMRAMILRTVEDYNSEGELAEEAIEYMEAEEDDYVFSFRAICRHLNLDPDKTRYAIMNANHRIRTRRRAA